MAGERVITPTTGKWGLDATTGKRLLLDSSDECDECCGGACTASATTCGSCSAGDTPTAYTAIFSLVNLCTACRTDAVIGVDINSSWTTGDALNGTHTLTQVGGIGTGPMPLGEDGVECRRCRCLHDQQQNLRHAGL